MNNISNRIGYIDALRGFMMLLVVFHHIYLPNYTPLCMLLITLRMPLFFFISGYISYRANQEWSIASYHHRIVDKLRTLIIPITLFGIIYSLVTGVTIYEFIANPYKNGYWFTLSLFEMLALYYTVRLITARHSEKSRGSVMLYLFIGTTLLHLLLHNHVLGKDIISLNKTIEYIPFFTFGLLAGHYRNRLNQVVDSHYAWHLWGCFAIIATVILTQHRYISDYVLEGNYHHYAYIMRYAVEVCVSIVGILTVYAIFRRLRKLFDHDRSIKPLQYIGRHTLEVYLFHYFLLINFTPALRPYIVDDPNIFMQIVVGFSVATIIAGIALLIGYVIRLEPHLDYYIMGGHNKRFGKLNRQ